MTAGVDWPTISLDTAQPLFTPAVVEMIIRAVRIEPVRPINTDQMADTLDEVAQHLLFGLRKQEDLSPKQIGAKARAVRKAGEALMAALGCRLDDEFEPGEINPSLGPDALFAVASAMHGGSGRERVEVAVRHAAALTGWASVVEQRAALLTPRRRARNIGNPAIARFLNQLGEIYAVTWGAVPAASGSRNSEEGGPFARFLFQVNNHLAANVKGFRRKQPAALAAAWRRADSVADELKELIASWDKLGPAAS